MNPFDPVPPCNPETLMQQAFRIANRAIVADIQSECQSMVLDGYTWWDTLPMTSEHEHSNEVLDMVTECLSFALASGLIVRHPQMPQLVRVREGTTVLIDAPRNPNDEDTPS